MGDKLTYRACKEFCNEMKPWNKRGKKEHGVVTVIVIYTFDWDFSFPFYWKGADGWI